MRIEKGPLFFKHENPKQSLLRYWKVGTDEAHSENVLEVSPQRRLDLR